MICIEAPVRWASIFVDLVSRVQTWKRLGGAILGLSIMMNAHADSELPSVRSGESAPALSTGISRFMFKGWKGPQLRVWTYVPSSIGADAPILFVMHGVERDAKRYIEEWARTAERHGVILVAPEFDERRFPGPDDYNQGGVIDPLSGKKRPREMWTFSVIEPLFEEVRLRAGSGAATYSIYGHSAGAQFVHRYVMMARPLHLEQAVAANAGWYTGFDPGRAYPRGLKLNKRNSADEAEGFAQRLTILLGTEDIESDDKNLRTDAWARDQGENRFERGRAFFSNAQTLASRSTDRFAWRLRYAPGVGHENRKMAAHAADILFRQDESRPRPSVVFSVRRNGAAGTCDAAIQAPDEVQGLGKTGCSSLSDHEFITWAARSGALLQGEEAVTLDQPLRAADELDVPPGSGRSFKTALIDAGGKDPRESSALQRKLDALEAGGTDLVLLVNSPADGRVRRTGRLTLVHLPRERRSRRDREAGQTPGDMRVLLAITPEPSNRKIRLVIYPALSGMEWNQTENERSIPRQWKPFSDAVRRIMARTRDQIRFEAGRDEQGDYLAFDVDWSGGD